MTLTTRHKGVIKSSDGLSWKVIALTWFDESEWGGFLEVLEEEEKLRETIPPDGSIFELQLDDGRIGKIRVRFSEFIADGKPPLVFSGESKLKK